MSRPQHELRAQIPCRWEAMEQFCQKFRSWHASSNSARDAFASELLLREALANGVSHGGRLHGSISCVLRGGANRLLIAIRDGGRGFDWRAASLAAADNNAISGRGIAIYRRYAHRIRFNKSGNGVTLVRFFTAGSKEKTT